MKLNKVKMGVYGSQVTQPWVLEGENLKFMGAK